MSNRRRKSPSRGPAGWENWQAFSNGSVSVGAFEVALYTDSRVVAEVKQLGPYQLLNTVPAVWAAQPGYAELAVVLRVEVHDDHEPDYQRDNWNRADLGSYHGGTLGDEIASLIALILGIRMRAGGTTRTFGFLGDDPRGIPGEFEHLRPPLVPPRRGQPSVLPTIAVDGALLTDAVPLMETYSRLKIEDASELVRAARFYERAIWNADADAGIAWLELISAVEVAAGHWRSHTASDAIDRLRRNAPGLAAAVDPAGEEIVQAVAREAAHLFGAIDRFVSFLDAHLPPAPEPRPEQLQLDWTNLGRPFRAIYDRRSDALHRGAPIPWVMCVSPRRTENGAYEEHSGGLGSWSGGAYWPSTATPMNLNTFAYVVRGALLSWWKEMAPSAPPDS